MPAPVITSRPISHLVGSTAQQSIIFVTAEVASTGRVDITYFNEITPLFLTIDCLCLVEDVDYQIIEESGSTFIEFINELAPSGISALEAGEVLTFVYNLDADTTVRNIEYTLTAQQCLESRIDVTPNGNFTTLIVSLNRIVLIENLDYELQILGSTKYLYFLGDLAYGGIQAVEPGEIVTLVVRD